MSDIPMIENKRRLLVTRSSTGGFTVMELVITMVIMAIVAVTVVVKWTGTDSVFNVTAARAEQVANDIRYTQSLAMARATSGQRFRITFSTGSYTIADNSGATVKSVSLGSGITFANNTFTGGYLAFDSMGRSYNGATLMASILTISITGSGGPKTISVWDNTGAVTVS